LHRAGIVSIDNVDFDFKTLGFNEKFWPKNCWYNIVKSYQFSFGGTSSVNFLFCRDGADGTRAKSHSGSSVTFHVFVDGKGSIDMSLDRSYWYHQHSCTWNNLLQL
jgi:hypothetical protein